MWKTEHEHVWDKKCSIQLGSCIQIFPRKLRLHAGHIFSMCLLPSSPRHTLRHPWRWLRIPWSGEDLDWPQGVLTQTFEIKIRGRLGPEKQDDKHMRILNRCVEWGTRGLKYEADPRHAEILIRELGLEKSSSVISASGTKEKIEDHENHEDEPLDGEWSTKFRRLIARATFLSMLTGRTSNLQ